MFHVKFLSTAPVDNSACTLAERLSNSMSEGHPRGNGDGPLTTNRFDATKGGCA